MKLYYATFHVLSKLRLEGLLARFHHFILKCQGKYFVIGRNINSPWRTTQWRTNGINDALVLQRAINYVYGRDKDKTIVATCTIVIGSNATIQGKDVKIRVGF